MTIKKIAIAAIAALTIGAFSVPANAAVSAALTVDGTAVESATSANPVLLPVPTDNSIDSEDALKVIVSDLAHNTAVTVSATNATVVPALATVDAPVTATSGSANFTGNSTTGTTVTFYVYTKTVAKGSVAVTVGGDTNTYYVQGIAGSLKNLFLAAPTSGVGEKDVKIKPTGTDLFGNPVAATTVNAVYNTNGVITTGTLTTGTEHTITLPASGTVTVSVYATNVVQASATIVARDLISEIAALNAQVATLTTQLATSDATVVSLKAKFNALAKKWNKKFPKKKVLAVK